MFNLMKIIFIFQQQCQKPCPQRKKKQVSIGDPIVTLLQVIVAIGRNTVKVQCDATIFRRISDISLYIHMSDVLEVETGNQELNISVIQLWMM